MKKTLQKLWLLAIILTAGVTSAWGAEGDTHDFSQTLSQLLNNSASISSINITEQSYSVKEIIVTCKYNKSIENAVTIDVTLGGESFGESTSIGNSFNSTVSFEGTAAKGAIVISFTNNTGSGTGHGTFSVTNVRLVEGPSASGKSPQEWTLSETSTTLNLAATYNLADQILGTTYGDVTYESSAPEVASVTTAGLITALTEGTATITVTASGDDDYDVREQTFEVTVVDPTKTTYDFSAIDFTDWSSSYAKHTVSYTDADVVFASANKSSSTITDIPVTKGNDVELVLKDSKKVLTSVKFVCRQWGIKTQTITLHYSIDGGTNYTATSVTSSNFTIESNSLPEGTNAVKISFNSTSNQVGIESASISLGDAPVSAVEAPTFSVAGGTYLEYQSIEIDCETEGATIYYSFNNEDFNEYTGAIAVNKTKTIYAYAQKGEDKSLTAHAEYVIHKYESLVDLVADGNPGNAGYIVKVNLSDETIVDFYKNKSGYTNGVYVWAGDELIEIYCYDVPETWVYGGKLSYENLECTWKTYSGTNELCPSTWDGFIYTAPIAQTATIAASGYSTFSAVCDVTIPEGVEAYYASGVSKKGLHMKPILTGKIPANTGVVLKGTASQTYTFETTTDAEAVGDNYLVATTTNTSLAPTVGTMTNYVLVDGHFCPFTGTATVAAGKAYLSLAKDDNAILIGTLEGKIILDFGDETGVAEVAGSKEQVAGNFFDLMGRKVETPVKGNIYIVNGKKYIY